jgi:hypothetical protein
LAKKRLELKLVRIGWNRHLPVAEQWWMNAGRTVFSQLIAHLSHVE